MREVRERLADELGIDPGEPLRRLEQDVLRQDPSLDLAAPATSARHRRRPAADETVAAAGPRAAAGAAPHGWSRRPAPDGRGAAGVGGRGHREVPLLPGGRRPGGAAGLMVGWGTWEQEDGSAAGRLAAGVRRAAGRRGRAHRRRRARQLLDGVPAGRRDRRHAAGAAGLCGARRRPLGRPRQPPAAAPGRVDARPGPVAARRREPGGGAGADPRPRTRWGPWPAATPTGSTCGGSTATACAAQVHEALGHAVDPSVADALRERTDGNPFYVREMVRALAPTGVLEGARIDDWGGVPAGVRDVVRHRLAGLPPSVGRALTAASVLGRTFDADVLEGSWDGSPEDLDDALGLAEGVGLVEPADQPGRYRFVHALARDAVYEELSGAPGPVPMPVRGRAGAGPGRPARPPRRGLAEHYRQAGRRTRATRGRTRSGLPRRRAGSATPMRPGCWRPRWRCRRRTPSSSRGSGSGC